MTRRIGILLALALTGCSSSNLVYEGFDYPVQKTEFPGASEDPRQLAALNGGKGWSGSWYQWFSGRQNNADIQILPGVLAGIPTGVARQGSTKPEVHHAHLRRALRQPLGGQTTWLSFAMQANTFNSSVGFELLTGGIQGRPVFSLMRGQNENWRIGLGDLKADTPTRWDPDGGEWFYVFKIVDDGKQARVFGNRYRSSDSLTQEPQTWQVNGLILPSFTFDAVVLRGNAFDSHRPNNSVFFDEIRIARSFDGVIR